MSGYAATATAKQPGFLAQLLEQLYPKENRLIAAVAFVRTFGQGLTGSAFVAAGGGITLTAVGLTQINWQLVGLAAVAVGLSALVSAIKAWQDVSRNGLSSRYAKALIQTVINTGDTGDAALKQAIVTAADSLTR